MWRCVVGLFFPDVSKDRIALIFVFLKVQEKMVRFIVSYDLPMPIAVAARSKAWVFGRLLTGIVGSNPA
jgi:hypothetical protein